MKNKTTTRKQIIGLVMALVFLCLAVVYSVRQRQRNLSRTGAEAHSHSHEECCDNHPADAKQIMTRELDAMNSLAAILEEIYSSGNIMPEDMEKTGKICKKWRELSIGKKSLSPEERRKAMISLGKKPEEVLQRMHKAQAAILTMKGGNNLMLMIKAIMDEKPR